MALHTVPNLFPLLFVQESFTRKTIKASLFRKFCMAQNYIWSKHRRIYAMGGIEGYGNRVFHMSADAVHNSQGGERTGAEYTPIYDSAASTTLNTYMKGVPITCFLVPPNWGGSSRVQVQVGYNFKTGTTSIGYIVASLQKLDGTFVTHASAQYTSTDESDKVATLIVDVPQDGLYQMKVYLILQDGDTSAENSYTGEYIEARFVSARYCNANAAEMGGDTAPATWTPMADFMTDDLPISSVFLKRLTENLQHLQAYRPPELCQVYCKNSWNNTSSFVEVGRYHLWTPSRVTKWKGKLVIYCTNGGAGNEVRVLVNGSVKETFTALSAGENLKDLAEITVTDNQENIFTIEAKSTAASADWGTAVWGVQLWESGTTLGLPTGTTVPTNYKSIDEDGLEGDDVITAQTDNAFAQRVGLRTMFDNDRWLAFNRLRWLIGDWRHKVLKNGGLDDEATTPDPRVSWTYGEYITFTDGYDGYDKFKNITVRGDSSSADDVDGYGGSSTSDGDYNQGLQEDMGGNLAPYTYPAYADWELKGRRLGKWSAVRPTSVRTHMKDLGGVTAYFRARRLRPTEMSVDINGAGPAQEETAYQGKAYLEFLWGTDVYRVPIVGAPTGMTGVSGIGVPPMDTKEEWLAPVRTSHTDADQTYKVRGRLPSQPFLAVPPNVNSWQATHAYTVGQRVTNGSPKKLYVCITAGTSAGAGGPTTTAADITDGTVHWRYVAGQYGRPEGMLFEVELKSWCIMDEPLEAALLSASPYA